MFIHEDPDFLNLIGIVAGKRGLALAIVEKDYWVTHALWSLGNAGFDVWFKGGTSLSKGFDLIQRFSEDLDLKLEHSEIPQPTNWSNESAAHCGKREAFFRNIEAKISAPGLTPNLAVSHDGRWRDGKIQLVYDSRTNDLPSSMRPFVLLEIGDATVTPFVRCDIVSFVHVYLNERGQLAEFTDNRVSGVRCLHPLVTLLEKIDNLGKNVPSGKDPREFARHFEDAARIIQKIESLPTLPDHPNVVALAGAMTRAIRPPRDALTSLQHDDATRWTAIAAAYAEIQPMFWGPRLALDECRSIISDWLTETFPSA